MTIETLGEQGDGIEKVEHSYVVIVPGAHPGAAPTVEIEQDPPTVAFASIVESDPWTLSLSPLWFSALSPLVCRAWPSPARR